ncbi:Undecaprenyl-phosphate 4-deoxy-4-formamido-L-arabinose transferase [bacterium HR21]|nr:Undecaprenyl-phosphate 4-deoxy-4-formamido-L-arabinose transferase [bacterium HR21]
MERVPHDPCLLSLVVPFYNEAESLPELLPRLIAVAEQIAGQAYEIWLIDDGSTDGSFQVVRRFAQENPRVHGIRFRRNYGKSAALAVGFAEAQGRYVVTLDADLQDEPEEIPRLLAKLEEGYDLVSGWKRHRQDPLSKTLPSRLFNAVVSLVSGLRLHDFNCGLKAYRSEVVKTLQIYGEMHRYIPALAHWEGFRVTELPVRHHPRKYGRSKFGASRFVKGFLDLLTFIFTTRFLRRPLHLFGTLGIVFVVAGLLVDAYLVVEWWLGRTALSNRPLLFFGLGLIIVGVQLVSLGLLGELVVKGSLAHGNYNIVERL